MWIQTLIQTNFGENGKNHLFLLLRFINPTSLELRQQILIFGKEILEIVEGFWIQSEKFHLEYMSPHLILFSKNSFHGGPDFIGGFTGGYVKEELRRNETANSSKRFIHPIQILVFFYG
jgi:hypothetical protein